MKNYNIRMLAAYLHRVNDRLEKYVDAIRPQIEQNIVSWNECEQLIEVSNLAEWVAHQAHQLEGIAKEQRFSLGYLYRCKKSDPLEVVKQGKLYRLREWHDTYIVCGEGFAISKRNLNEYFERMMEPEDKVADPTSTD